MNGLRDVLGACLAAQGEPGDPDAELDALLDDRIFQIIDLLIERHGEWRAVRGLHRQGSRPITTPARLAGAGAHL